MNELVGGDIQHNEQSNQEELLQEDGQPVVGMMFENMEEARQYYVEYGKRIGFQIRTRSTARIKARSDEVTGATFVCAREGKLRKLAQEGVYNVRQESLIGENEKGKTTQKKRSTSTVKNGCKAYMRVSFDVFTMKWKVTQFQNLHNHNFITPSKRAMMRAFKEIPTAARDLAEAFRREGLPVGKVPAIFGGDHATFDSKDC